jgi:hypothetical protein
MKRTTTILFAGLGGLLLGAVLSLGLPLALSLGAKNQTPELIASDDGLIHETFVMQSPTDAIAATHDGNKPIAAFPSSIPLLNDPQIKAGFALVAKLRDEAGNIVGFTSEQEVVSADSNILQGRMEMDTTWTVTLPGRGTLFLSQREDAAQFARDVVMPAFLFNRPLAEPMTMITTAGPADDGSGLIVGGTGEFAGITGHFVEVTRLSGFSRESGIEGTIELQLGYSLPAR